MKFYLAENNISLISHLSQQNGITKRHHHHAIKNGLTLIHESSLLHTFRTYTFLTMIYLATRLGTPPLNLKSLFQITFGQTELSKNKNFLLSLLFVIMSK